MNDAPANPDALEIAGSKPPGEGWPQKKFLAVVAIIFAAHLAVIFLFGQKKETVPRAVKNVPVLKLADKSSELFALDDPTLFALPHLRGFSGFAWFQPPPIKLHRLDWTEPPHWLPFSAENLGATFQQFMRTNFFDGRALDFKPEIKMNIPPSAEIVSAQNSTLQIEGEIARRKLISEISLTSWPAADVIAPSVVQVLVNPAGEVISAVLLPPENAFETAARDAGADQRALEIARAARFAPSPQLAVGQMIFNWNTIPPAQTKNEPGS